MTNAEQDTELTTPEKISISTIPYDRVGNKARYLGYRCCGFLVRESLKKVDCAESTLSWWRTSDPEFARLEKDLPALRKSLGIEYANLEFLRNYRLILEKDFEVISKSLKKNDSGETMPLTHQENQYLMKARSHYTPQQLQVMEALLSSDGSGEAFDFTKITMQFHRRDETLIISGEAQELPRREVVEVIDGRSNS